MTNKERFDLAAAWRQKFAEERGFPDFAAVMAYGIVRAWNLPVQGIRPAPPTKPAEEIKP